MATIRERLAQQKRLIMRVIYSGIAAFVGSALFLPYGGLLIGSFLGLGMVLGAIAYGYSKMRCPRCRARLASLVMNHNSVWLSPGVEELNYCPICGVDLEMHEGGKA